MPNRLRVGKGLRTYALRHSTGEKSVEAASSQWDTHSVDSALARLHPRVELDANPLAVTGSTRPSAERIPISDLRRAPRMHPRVSSHVVHYRFISSFTRVIDFIPNRRHLRNEKVRGSSPLSSTSFVSALTRRDVHTKRGSHACDSSAPGWCVPPLRSRAFERSKPARSAEVPRWCR
jgi:hypothetical protein